MPTPVIDPLQFYFKNGYFVGDPDIGFQLNFTHDMGGLKKPKRLLGESFDKQKQVVAECQRAINRRLDEINAHIDQWNEKNGNRFMFNAIGDSIDEALAKGEFASVDLKKALKVENIREIKKGVVEFDSGDGWYSARLEGYIETEKKKIAVYGKNKKHIGPLRVDGIPGSKFQAALKEYLEINPEIVPSSDPIIRKLADMLKKNRVSSANDLLENVLLANYTGKDAIRMQYTIPGGSITPKENPYLFTWPSRGIKEARPPISDSEKSRIRLALGLHVKGLPVNIRATDQDNIVVEWRSKRGERYAVRMKNDRARHKVFVSGAVNREYGVMVGGDGKAKVYDTRKVLEADCSLFIKDTLENKLRTIRGVSGLEDVIPRDSRSQYRYLFDKTHSRKENPFSENNRLYNQKDNLDNGQIYVAFWKNPKKDAGIEGEYDHIGFVVWRENQLLFNWPAGLKTAKERVLSALEMVPRNASAKVSGDKLEVVWKDRKTKADKKAVIWYDERNGKITVSGDVNRTYNLKKTSDGRLEIYGGAWFFINNTRKNDMTERLETDSTLCWKMVGRGMNHFITPTGIKYEAPQELAPGQQKVIKLAKESKLAKERETAELHREKQKLRM